MSNGLHEGDANGVVSGGFDPDVFARRVREVALQIHRVLRRPDGPIDDVFDLHRRVWGLLGEAPGPQTTGVYRRLLAARQAIADRLHRWATEELDSLVA
jgi:hypothetical protein